MFEFVYVLGKRTYINQNGPIGILGVIDISKIWSIDMMRREKFLSSLLQKYYAST